jgi:hypothetical protein
LTNKQRQRTMSLREADYQTLREFVLQYEEAEQLDGEGNEAADNIAQFLVEYRRRGGLRP